jgi:genome maintenance exonuclease 1
MLFNPLPPAPSQSMRQQGQQYFIDRQGQRLPSVTTILNATRPPEQRQALARWKERVGAEAAAQISGAASRRGSGTHKQVERYLRGDVVLCSEGVRPYWESMKPVLQAVDEVRLLESTVFHYGLSYAGKVDCVASYAGVPCLCEWKTSDRPKQSLERLYDYPLQLVAYWGAVNHFYQGEGVDLGHALLAIALPNAPAELFWFDRASLMHYWQQWQERVQRYWRRQGGQNLSP